MRTLATDGLATALTLGAAARADVATSPATTRVAEAVPLAKWIEDKEFVSLRFAGPKMDVVALGELTREGTGGNGQGIGGGVGGKGLLWDIQSQMLVTTIEWKGQTYVGVEMKSTEENIKRLKALIAALESKGYHDEPGQRKIWAYKLNEKARAEMQKLAEAAGTAFEKSIKGTFSGAKVMREEPTPGDKINFLGLKYEVPDGASGIFRIALTTESSTAWVVQMVADQTLLLPHAGLIENSYWYSGNKETHSAIRAIVKESMGELIKREPEAQMEERPVR